jgi:hypothetical protein
VPPESVSQSIQHNVLPASELVNFDSAPRRYSEYHKRDLYSYRWDNNSCWIDSGVELFCKAYFRLGPSQRSMLLTAARSSPAFHTLYQHMGDRLKWRIGEGAKWSEFDTGKECLRNGQSAIRSSIIEAATTALSDGARLAWGLCDDNTGDARSWMAAICSVRSYSVVCCLAEI